jgi:chaperonin GroEL
VKGKEDIANVASISANNDKELGNLIAELFEKVGKSGGITVEEGKTVNHEIEFVEGLKFDRGYQSPYFATNPKTNTCELDNPLILVSNQKVPNIQAILKYLEFAVQNNRPLLIISEEVETEPLTSLILNRLKGNLRICCVKAPGFGDGRKSQMQDIAIVTGATVIDEEVGLTSGKRRARHSWTSQKSYNHQG